MGRVLRALVGVARADEDGGQRVVGNDPSAGPVGEVEGEAGGRSRSCGVVGHGEVDEMGRSCRDNQLGEGEGGDGW